MIKTCCKYTVVYDLNMALVWILSLMKIFNRLSFYYLNTKETLNIRCSKSDIFSILLWFNQFNAWAKTQIKQYTITIPNFMSGQARTWCIICNTMKPLQNRDISYSVFRNWNEVEPFNCCFHCHQWFVQFSLRVLALFFCWKIYCMFCS